ncbi:LysE/ArgO family amino acid transporter [Arthrobacter sp. zg-Y1219]|uniref:LysE/ArgO family amino acid transporter n=1 Tax=Arthrobacter sp. zg-Y1219 TaxID=3049067 RepID=UPI0024C21D44|nr:LysE/ArgO family amino acid transporter [Arthrobacter sp. zg-Y1219]MDK1361533.1 LysE/ArgO family amino acid transporter [Arthrobacter sp. zg-Y1219]
MWSIWGTGLLTGLGLIVAIGAQNAFVLRQGIRREHVAAVVVLCAASDAVLILAGTAGIGTLVDRFPQVLDILRWGGAVYLAWFAVRSFMSALKPSVLTGQAPRSRGSVISTTLALTFLNPHVYLDTVVLLGSLANQYGEAARWIFAAGAVLGSILWFSGLGYGARALSGALSRPRTWQVLDLLIGIVMLALAVKLVLG